jgi:hypothetical protein
MRALTLLLLRLVTGLYLLAWSVVKLQSTERAIEISDKLYFGYLSSPVVQHGLGALGGVLALFVILGFLRSFSYLVHALVLAIGVGALGHIVAPVTSVPSGVEAAILLAPYVALVLVALVPLIMKGDDVVSIDRFLAWAERRLSRDEKVEVIAVPVAAAAVAAEAVAHAAPDHPHDVMEPVAEPVEAEVEAAPSYYEEVGEEPVEEVAEEIVEEPAHATEEPVEEPVEAAEVEAAEPVVAEAEDAHEAAVDVAAEAPVVVEAEEAAAVEDHAAEGPAAEEHAGEAHAAEEDDVHGHTPPPEAQPAEAHPTVH